MTTKTMTTVLSIAIANGFCAVCDLMYQSQKQECEKMVTDAIDGFKVYKKEDALFLLAEGSDAFLKSDRVNSMFGEEHVIIHDFSSYGCIFEVR